MRLLSENNLVFTGVATINNLNFDEIEDIIKLVKENGGRAFEYGLVLSLGRAKEDEDDLIISPEQLKAFQEKINDLKNIYNSQTFKIFGDEEQMIEVLRRQSQINCGAGHMMLSILADGTVTPCLSLQTKIGNVKKQSLFDILQSDIISFFRGQKAPNLETCQDCSYFVFCEGCFAKAITMKKECDWKKSFQSGCEKYAK
ncbi:MAG: radical SAM protein [Halanaerobiales bacterium]|nr:radical SAM protein [Halanaerobiales bacterium]